VFTLSLVVIIGQSDAQSLARGAGQKVFLSPVFWRGDGHLKNGEYEKGPPDYKHVRLDSFVIKDLNGDHEQDAVVILAQNSGGSGTFYEITALLSRGRDIVQTNSIYLGDRVRIEKLQVENKNGFPPAAGSKVARIRLDLLTHKETDPLCCPSKKESRGYSLSQGRLVLCSDRRLPKGGY